jgi:hypothetical protein
MTDDLEKMVEADHPAIWLQPECCADGDGRMWCEDPDPVACEGGVPWTCYVRGDIYDKEHAELSALRSKIAGLESALRSIDKERDELTARLRSAREAENRTARGRDGGILNGFVLDHHTYLAMHGLLNAPSPARAALSPAQEEGE